tara:strand:- start:5433 stop:5561 length:129 start_codon:yes stop_codon:yes gene_type:complete
MTKDNTIEELLNRLAEEIKTPKDSVHKIVLKITIDNIEKLLN